jgi:dTDP-4-amino-4,6-dideoxygalactose transaminase
MGITGGFVRTMAELQEEISPRGVAALAPGLDVLPKGRRLRRGIAAPSVPKRRKTFLSFSPPFIDEEAIAEVVETLRSDWISTGPKARRFEAEFASFLQASSALAVNSGTAALHLALASLEIGPGDAVITTPMTFCSTVHVIEQAGARPVLVDVEPDTLNIDPEKIKEAIECVGARCSVPVRSSEFKIKAILPVHLYGHPCEMDRIFELAQQYHLAVIEDAAHALPARYKGRLIGSPIQDREGASPAPERYRARARALHQNGTERAHEGEKTMVSSKESPSAIHDLQFRSPNSFNPQSAIRNPHSSIPHLTCFSFYATKSLTTGEGGMLTGPEEVLERARILSLHGMNRDAWKRYSSEGSWYYEVVAPGFKYNLTDVAAALGLHQLRKLPRSQARRREIVKRYDEAFSSKPELQTPASRPEVEHAWHLYVLRLNLNRMAISRNQFIEELKSRNIGTSVHFIPIHLHPYFREKFGYRPDEFPVAFHEYERLVSLPLNPRMTDDDVEDVIAAVFQVIKRFGM